MPTKSEQKRSRSNHQIEKNFRFAKLYGGGTRVLENLRNKEKDAIDWLKEFNKS